jgi:nitrite reductase (NADH) small subunit
LITKVIDSKKMPNEGDTSIVLVGEYEVCIANIDGEMICFDNLCPHAHASLGQGKIKDGNIICPLHQFKFNVKDGTCNIDRFSLKHHSIEKINDEYVITISLN